MSDKEINKPMDPSAREGDAPTMYKPTDRTPYAMDRLIEEVTTLFPGITYKVGNRNPRGVAFDVTFSPDITYKVGNRNPRGVAFDVTFSPGETLRSLLVLVDSDGRLRDIFASAEGVTVSFRNDVHSMDDRTPFGLVEAWNILDGESL